MQRGKRRSRTDPGSPSLLPTAEFQEVERYELAEGPAYHFAVDRRVFLQTAGAGLLLLVLSCQQAEGQGGAASGTLIEARLRLGEDGRVTVLNGKVEEGQGARTELAMVAAEELRMPLDRVDVQMADTAVTPDDGITAGSRTTPSTVPAVRQAAAAARTLLLGLAAQRWNLEAATLQVQEGFVASANGAKLGYGDLATDASVRAAAANKAELTPPGDWQILGKASFPGHPRGVVRVTGRDIVTGSHRFPSDVERPGTLYGAVLRPPSFEAKLAAIDLEAAKALGAVAVRDGDFVGCAAPTSFAARKAVEAIRTTAKWEQKKHPAQSELWDLFRKTAQAEDKPGTDARLEEAVRGAAKRISATFEIPYVAHAPMEPRAAAAEWTGDSLTVWTGTSNPFRVRGELAQAFGIAEQKVRVIVPDFGGGFGGKHTGEAALEAARLSRGAGKPVSLRWTRPEEFTWAYLRPAALIEAEAAVDGDGKLTAWKFLNYNSGGSGLRSPYRIGAVQEKFLRTETPLRQGSYRALASYANNFAREVLMDEAGRAAGADPLAFRLAHLENARLRTVVERAAEKFGWTRRARKGMENRAVGIACGEEKNSVVAACVEVELDPVSGVPHVLEVVQAYECGAVLNPAGLRQQVEGCIVMALGPALHEAIRFGEGRVANPRFASYPVPRFRDVPKIELVLVDLPNEVPKGAGETPIIAVAPAIANAVFALTGKPVRSLPIRADAERPRA
jgi:isoquinoline 1-oxidoreductase